MDKIRKYLFPKLAEFLLFVGILGIAVSELNAQYNYQYNGSYYIRHFDVNDYQSSAQVWSATSDQRNLMFFGSNKHLMVYDGVSWKKHQASNQSILRSLAVDTNNAVYAGSYNEFGVFLPDTLGGYRYQPISKHLSDTIEKFRDVWQTYATSHGKYFITQKKIFRYHHKKITQIPVNLAPLFAFNINDKIWLIDKNKGLARLKNEKLIKYPNFEKVMQARRPLVNILSAGKHRLRIITKNNGIFFYHTKDKKLTRAPVSDEVTQYLNKTELYTSARLDDSTIAIGTLRGGIIIMNEEGELKRIVNKTNGLNTGSIYALYADKFRNLWVMGASGIDLVFTSYPIHHYGERQGMDDYVLDVIQFEGNTYICTLNGLFRLNNYKIGNDNDQKTIERVGGITESAWGFNIIKNHLFMRSAKGLYHIQNGKAKNLLPGKFIFAIKNSTLFPGKIWLGLKQGLATADIEFLQNGKVQITNYKKFDQVTSRILKIVETNDKNVFLGSHTEGLQLLQFKNIEINKPRLTKFSEKHGLPENTINIAPHYIDNKLYIATGKGLYVPKKQRNNKIESFTYDTLFNPILKDSTKISGIVKINDTTYIIKSDEIGILYRGRNRPKYTKAPFRRIRNKITHVRYNHDMELLNICTPNSFYIYDMKAPTTYNKAFRPLLRKIAIGNDSVIFNGNFTRTKTPHKIYLHQTKDFTPEISYKNNNLTIDYASVFYADPEKTKYQYMIAGFDKQYSSWTGETQVKYTNVPAGNYTFKLRARNVYGKTSKTTTFRFSVAPPWYRTVWAYIVYGIVVTLLIMLIVRIYTYALKKQNKRLDAIVKARTAELREKNEQVIMQRDEIEQQKEEISVQKDELEIHKNHLEQLVEQRTAALKKAKERAEESDNLKSAFLANMSHEIRTPMNAIIGYADLMAEEDDKEAQQNYLEMISININNLLMLIENIIDLSKLETNQIQPVVETVDPEQLVHKVYRNYLEKVREKNLKLTIAKDNSTPLIVKSDSKRLEQILVQLVDNAMKYTQEGEIVIGMEKEHTDYPGYMVFYIKDTGVGMSKQGINMVFKRFTKLEHDKKKLYRGTGIGLALCQKLVHLLGGKIWIDSEPNKGTSVYFTIPKQ